MGKPSTTSLEMGSPVLTGTFTGTGQSSSVSFYGRFNVSLYGTFVAAVQLERSFDGGSNWLVASEDAAGTAASWTSAITVVANESEAGVLYRLNCTAYTSGTVTYRLSGGPQSGK